jgi:hypothetical protein
MRRDDMPPLERAVSDTIDEYLIRHHSITTGRTHPDHFLEWLAENGYTVAPIEPQRPQDRRP